ncbi:hypothetical protein [Algoriphagus sp.]|uniref:hypothetical protein n=1 Tax=Algoriphagus sp. TaxID=1872435 RepID=UPI00391D4EB3
MVEDNEFHKKSAQLIFDLQHKRYDDLLKWYEEMLYSFVSVQQSLADAKVKLNSRWKDSETLVNKLILHLIALMGLFKGTEIEIKGKDIKGRCKDISSLYVLLRAILENLLIYNHIFISSINEEEVSFKYDVWIMSSLIGRQKIEPISNSAKEIHLEEKLQIEVLRERIKKSAYFQKITSKQQNELLKRGDSRIFKPWVTLLDEMGFGNVFGIKDAYFIMSNHAHSEAISIMQINDSKSDSIYEREKLYCYSVVYGMIFISRIFVIQLKKYKISELKFNMLNQDLKDRILTLEKASYYSVEKLG